MIFGGRYQALLLCESPPLADAERAEGTMDSVTGCWKRKNTRRVLARDCDALPQEQQSECIAVAEKSPPLQTSSFFLNDLWALKLDLVMDWGELPSEAEFQTGLGYVWEPIYHNRNGWVADNVWRIQTLTSYDSSKPEVMDKDPAIPAFDSHGADSPVSYRNMWPSSRSGAAVWQALDSTFMFGGLGMLHQAQLELATSRCEKAYAPSRCAAGRRHEAVVLNDLWRFHGVYTKFVAISKSLVRNVQWDLMHSTTQSVFQKEFLAPFGTMFEQTNPRRLAEATGVDTTASAPDAAADWPSPRHEAVAWTGCDGSAWLWGGFADASGDLVTAAQLWRFELQSDTHSSRVGEPIIDKTEVGKHELDANYMVSQPSVWASGPVPRQWGGNCSTTPDLQQRDCGRCNIPEGLQETPSGLESCQATCDAIIGCVGFVVKDDTGGADGPCTLHCYGGTLWENVLKGDGARYVAGSTGYIRQFKLFSDDSRWSRSDGRSWSTDVLGDWLIGAITHGGRGEWAHYDCPTGAAGAPQGC
jgi:hypothetical protein